MIASLLALAAIGGSSPVTLTHAFKAGERSQYLVTGTLLGQIRERFMNKPLPEEVTSRYKFTTEVLSVLPDGSAKLRYSRPSITEIHGETYDSPPVTTTQKADMDFLVTLSPVNEVTNQQRDNLVKGRWLGPARTPHQEDGLTDFLDDFMPEYLRLCAFTGSFDWALDLAPKLPVTPVNVGDTWSRTVGYQPQQKKGREIAVQRVDTVYTYRGVVKQGDKTYVRVSASLKLDSDIASWANRVSDGAAGLQKMIVRLTAEVNFDLDPASKRTVQATAKSDGYLLAVPELEAQDNTVELQFKSDTTMSLIGYSAGKPEALNGRTIGKKSTLRK